MGVDSQIVGNAGPAHSITHDGQVYGFRLIDQDAKAEWEKRLYRKAVAAAKVKAEHRPEGWLESKLVQIDDEFDRGDYGFLTERSIKLLGTIGGMEILVSILTGRTLLALYPLFAERVEEVKALLHLILKESFPGLKIEPVAEGGSPNG